MSKSERNKVAEDSSAAFMNTGGNIDTPCVANIRTCITITVVEIIFMIY